MALNIVTVLDKLLRPPVKYLDLMFGTFVSVLEQFAHKVSGSNWLAGLS